MTRPHPDCGRYQLGKRYVDGQCRPCWLFNHDVRYRQLWNGNPGTVTSPHRSVRYGQPCADEGPVVQSSCCGGENAAVRQCLYDGHDWDQCTRGPNNGKVVSCQTCDHHTSRPPAPTLVAEWNEKNLWPDQPGLRFNPSVIEHGDGYAFVYRTGWRGSQLWAGRLDRDFRAAGEPVKLELAHRECAYGREDPRFFRHRGRLHVAFTGVVGGRHIRHTSVLYARLSDDFGVEELFYPAYMKRRAWEKNWSFFDYGGDLYAVYSVTPHRVLAVDGSKAWLVYEERRDLPWAGGEVRGGASPVMVGDEWWSFFHDRVEEGGRIYRGGLYTFAAEPPFAPRRMIPEPLLVADRATKPRDQYCPVVWPGGAVRAGGRWTVACGIHDRTTALYSFEHSELERRLVSVG